MSKRRVTTDNGRVRAVIEAVTPSVDCGRYPIKRVAGEQVDVDADCFADGHDVVACLVLHRRAEQRAWKSVAMKALGNDRWRGSFGVESLGTYVYTVTAWVDAFLSWRHDFARRIDADDIRAIAAGSPTGHAGSKRKSTSKPCRHWRWTRACAKWLRDTRTAPAP